MQTLNIAKQCTLCPLRVSCQDVLLFHNKFCLMQVSVTNRHTLCLGKLASNANNSAWKMILAKKEGGTWEIEP